MKEQYKIETHNFCCSLRGTAYSYCIHCGLVNLKNDFTAWGIKQGCNYHEHPYYLKARMKYTGLYETI